MNAFKRSGVALGYRVTTLRSACLALALLVVAGAANAQQDISASELDDLLRVKKRTVQHMALNPLLVRAVRQQNALDLTQEEINKRDKEWRATKEATPYKLSLQTSPAGRFLKEQISRNTTFNEAFLTDKRGANVAAYPATSDYWQGDEEKWSSSFNGGKGRIFIGKLAFDESTNTVAAQVSAPVLDRGRTIGVLVVGVSINYLQTKSQ